ncbi:hypothetical protein LTR84_004288 [Exophiala bonariae]|uniref:Prolyl endopeptidase n=1 Tax=Exophiala bonariae TaxID=1690606 RepID=A0AAV9N6I4_9EURO|nr:hypothetical protein LTR84_004288 [Exophiala bonariae]
MADLKIPLARRSSTIGTFVSAQNGTVTVPNPYDWLEDTTSAETVSFIEAQNAAFASYLDDETLGPAKQRLASSMAAMGKLTIFPGVPQSLGDENGEYIIRTMGRGREFGVSYRVGKAALLGKSTATNAQTDQNGIQSPKIFYDEATYSSILTASSLSPSGSFWAFTTSDSGSDWGIIRVKDTHNGKILPDEVRGTKFASKNCSTIPWLRDRGFFYTYYPNGRPHRNRDVVKAVPPQLRFHILGTEQAVDEVVYEDVNHPGYSIKASMSMDARTVFLEVYDQGRGCQIWYASIDIDGLNKSVGAAPNENKKLGLKFHGLVSDRFDTELEYIGSSPDDSSVHFFWTTESNGKVVAYSPHDKDKGMPLREIIGPREHETLKFARLLSDGDILTVRSVDVRDQIQIFSSRTGASLTTVSGDKLPMWTILDVSFDPSTHTLFLLESAFTHPPQLWYTRVSPSVAATVGDREGRVATAVGDFKLLSLFLEDKSFNQHSSVKAATATISPPQSLSTTQMFYHSTDLTTIPMFLTSLSPRTSNPSPTPYLGPVLLYIYGAFGLTVIPHFRSDFITFLRVFRGSTLAVANIRGGGEYGTEWHHAAQKLRRQRLFDDVICAAEQLHRNANSRSGTAVRRKVILMGESMGGLNAASVMTQRPDLFDAVLLNAGVLDVLNRKRMAGTDRGVQEIGDVNEGVESDFIRSWTPLERILSLPKDEAKGEVEKIVYPPVLLTAGDEDDLVKPSHSLKMAAALQYHQHRDRAADRGTPAATHVRIIKNLGHGGNISAKQKAVVSVERWLWVKKTLGLEVDVDSNRD